MTRKSPVDRGSFYLLMTFLFKLCLNEIEKKFSDLFCIYKSTFYLVSNII